MTTDRRNLARLVAFVSALVCSSVACGSPPPMRVVGAPREAGGHLLLVGGGAKPDEVMQLFVRLAGGSDGSIVVMPLASEDSRETGAYYADLLRRHGATRIRVIHVDDSRDAVRGDYVDAIREADGVWFSGGDQSRITSRILDTPMHDALRAMLARGGVVGGTSAGTACQSDPMLVGEGAEDRIESGNISVARGLGLFPDVIIDQHFVARQRQNRLISVVLEHPDRVGVGVDEATAVWLHPDRRTIEVVGEGTVFVFDARQAEVARRAALLGASDVRVAVLVPGQRFDLQRGELVEDERVASAEPLEAP